MSTPSGRVAFFALVLLSLFVFGSGSPRAQSGASYQDLYNQGLKAIYEQNRPHDAIRLFSQAHAVDGRQWPAPFMVGYIYRSSLKQPAQAVPYLQKSAELAPDAPLPFNELTVAYAELGRFGEALEAGKRALSVYETKGEAPSDWLRNHVAYLYFKNGDIPTAQETATPDSGLAKMLKPKQIDIRWPVNLAETFRKWGVRENERVAITLPVDRPYHTLISANVEGAGIGLSKLEARGNRFLVLTRRGEEWPDQAVLSFRVRQTLVAELPGRRADFRAVTDESDPNYDFATDNGGGYYSQTESDFRDFVERVTSSADSEGEKADILLRHLRANFRYGPRRADRNIYEIFRSGTGDCGYYTVVAMGFLRARKIPVRFLYGFNAVYNPPLPHAVVEIYEAGKDRWVPHDPQSDDYYGLNNPGFVAFTAYPVDTGNPRSWNPSTPDNIRYVDTMNFFWADSQVARRQQVTVRELEVASRAVVRRRALKPASGTDERKAGLRSHRAPETRAPALPRSDGPPPVVGRPTPARR